MPSQQPIPSIQDLITAFQNAVVGSKDFRADTRTGSSYDRLAGPNAILMSRQMIRDRDLFRAVYTDSAEGDDLSSRLLALYGFSRVLDSYGTGFLGVSRPTSGAGAGTIFTGTRILVMPPSGGVEPKIYAVSADTTISSTQLGAVVPVRGTVFGVGSAIQTSSATSIMKFDDPVFDSTIVPTSISCSDGNVFENAQTYKARIKKARFDSRPGYRTAIINALVSAGATNVALFQSDYTGTDVNGLNVAYVGDSGFGTSTALLQNCRLALQTTEVLGTDVQILPMTTQVVPINVNVTTWSDPGQFGLVVLSQLISTSIQGYFDGRRNAFAYQLDAIAGAAASTSDIIQSLSFVTPTSSASVTSGSPPQWPAPITRFVFDPTQLNISFLSP